MSKALEEAKKLLETLPPRPWRVDNIPAPAEYQGKVDVGAIRAPNGGNILQPFPESSSFVYAPRGILDALVRLPSILDDLIVELDKDTTSGKSRPVVVAVDG